MAHTDFRIFLILWPLPFVVGLFLYGWASVIVSATKYYSADLHMTYMQRRRLASKFPVSGKMPEVSADLSDDELAATKYIPALKKSLVHMVIGTVAVMMIIISAIRYVLSQGEPQAIAKAHIEFL